MQPTEFSVQAPYGEKLYAWRVTPKSPPLGVICLVHGFGEHSMRYLHWANRFVGSSYAFVGFDLVGHGKTQGNRGAIQAYDQLVDEVDAVVKTVGEMYPGIPVVLYGHSMGGNIVINYALKRCCMVSLLVVTSPWLELTNPPLWPLRQLIKLLERVSPNLSFPARINPIHISSIPQEVEKYRLDTLNHGSITPRLYRAITKAGQFAIRNIHQISIPFLLMHGQSDQIASFEASSRLAVNSEKCSFIPWRRMCHELHNEAAADSVFQVILEWLSGNNEELS